MSLLEMKNIKKSFNGVEVLKDISLTVDKGEVLGIIGPSGSGKSTLLRCATGLEIPDSGEIHYEGTYGLVFQNFALEHVGGEAGRGAVKDLAAFESGLQRPLEQGLNKLLFLHVSVLPR